MKTSFSVVAIALPLAFAQPPGGGTPPGGGAGGGAGTTCNAAQTMTSSGLKFENTATQRVIKASGCANHVWVPGTNPNTATYQQFTMTVPLNPVATPTGTTAAPLGTTGLALNGVAFFSPDDASNNDAVIGEQFDVCGTHPTNTGTMHYHTLPVCLLACLGGTTPAVSDWAFLESVNSGNIRDWVAKWPTTGRGVQLGYMLDGRKIFSPYDTAGNLIAWGGIFNGAASVSYGNTAYTGDFSDVRSTLDECNGAMRDGEYVYYATPSPPWTPPCLKTNTLGTVTGQCTSIACPTAGLSCTASSGYSCPVEGICSTSGVAGVGLNAGPAQMGPAFAVVAAAIASALALVL